ncbi:protein pangolin-like [Penaeus indicus]|uniref:protein pangolin-like n=1 Tax=Penaeus indicus TaxID=29960 RepID=UPI00300D9ABB
MNTDDFLQNITYSTYIPPKMREEEPYEHPVPRPSSPTCDQTEDQEPYEKNVLKSCWNSLQSLSHESPVRGGMTSGPSTDIDSSIETLSVLQSERDLVNVKQDYQVALEEQDPLRVIDDNIPKQISLDAYQTNPSHQSTSSAFASREIKQSENIYSYVNQRINNSDDDTQRVKPDTPSQVPASPKVTNLLKYVDMRVNEKDATMTPGVAHVEKQDADSFKTEELLCPLEKKLRRPVNSIKRPMNKYMLFQNSMRPKLTLLYPGESSQNITQRLGKMWKDLPETEKAEWKGKAESLKEEHKRLHPDYSYNPKMAAQLKREYSRARMERRNLYRIHTYPDTDDNS